MAALAVAMTESEPLQRDRFVRLCAVHLVPRTGDSLACPVKERHPRFACDPPWVLWDTVRNAKVATVHEMKVTWEPGYGGALAEAVEALCGRTEQGFAEGRRVRGASAERVRRPYNPADGPRHLSEATRAALSRARLAKLSPERRTEIARIASAAAKRLRDARRQEEPHEVPSGIRAGDPYVQEAQDRALLRHLDGALARFNGHRR